MGLLTKSLGIRAISVEDPNQPLLPPGAMYESLGLNRSDAGVLVNEKTALALSTAFLCIKAISEDLASVSHEIIKTHEDGDTVERAMKHRQWTMIHDQPNPNMPYMTAVDFWAAIVAAYLGWGNGYARIIRDKAARPVAMHLLDPARTGIAWRNGLMYGTTQTVNGEVAWLDPWEVLHIRGLSLDGYVGLSPIQQCKNAFGIGMAAEKFAGHFFSNAARASGVLTHPEAMDPEAYQRLKKSFHEATTGDGQLKPIILEEGVTWQQITIAPEDAQMIQTRQFQRTEVCGIYRFPLHLAGDLARSTNNNIEHQSLDYVRYCLRPIAVRTEAEVNLKLLSAPYTMEHNLIDMQRGDFASQVTSLRSLRDGGVYSGDDVLRALRQNPMGKANGGDVRIVQSGFVNLKAIINQDSVPGADTSPTTDSDDGDTQPFDRKRAITAAALPVFRDGIGRICNRDTTDDEFAARAIRPGVAAMATAAVALKFGRAELSDSDNGVVDLITNALISGRAAWNAGELDALAQSLVNSAFKAIAEEIWQ
jgi:HK97 family phage portal protein